MHALAEAYERLLHDAMVGDHTLFTRQDGVERAWEIVIAGARTSDAAVSPTSRELGSTGSRRLLAPHHWHLRTRPDGMHHP